MFNSLVHKLITKVWRVTDLSKQNKANCHAFTTQKEELLMITFVSLHLYSLFHALKFLFSPGYIKTRLFLETKI